MKDSQKSWNVFNQFYSQKSWNVFGQFSGLRTADVSPRSSLLRDVSRGSLRINTRHQVAIQYLILRKQQISWLHSPVMQCFQFSFSLKGKLSLARHITIRKGGSNYFWPMMGGEGWGEDWISSVRNCYEAVPPSLSNQSIANVSL